MKRLTVDTELSFCDISQCDSIPDGSFCEDGRCDQRRCYEKLREYERSDLEPETLRKAQGLLKELKDARQTVELMDACGKRVCSSTVQIIRRMPHEYQKDHHKRDRVEHH